MKHILIIGAGFAGLWSAIAAARRLQETGTRAQITVLNRDAYHGIRVRYYEEDLGNTRVPLRQVLDPVGVKLVVGEVTGIDPGKRRVDALVEGSPRALFYDKLVIASGSALALPAIPGLAEHAFDIDTHASAMRLQAHVRQLAHAVRRPGWLTAVVVGAGATGVELACELPARLRAAAQASGIPDAEAEVRVILADREATACAQLGGARPVIERACAELGVELLSSVAVKAISPDGVTFDNGSILPSSTVVWCAGMRASPLNGQVSAKLDASWRLYVDACLKVKGFDDVFAAGDAAHMLIDGKMPSVMSCQHARPMGRFAGQNVVNDLIGPPLEPLHIDWYTNIIDLGPWGAVYAEGWDRAVRSEGEIAKQTKTVINRERIYPPLTGDKAAILAASVLHIQRPPSIGR
ncbi:NADH dehydrogenase-like protein MT1860 [Massilia sp. Bi118]|uniref:NAD(P)/FAD-dependent oxidoreductase n=1 Tax=Massilia sp. Bi118 TaxID=2822346 RepID=UPI001DE67228|nr:FAD-dependent oxidoreductase [Massilia sp. Bi118]CAH0281384.1 NADH dehydrogenase-like protein MT1860 [Massilia sp. Bi118]